MWLEIVANWSDSSVLGQLYSSTNSSKTEASSSHLVSNSLNNLSPSSSEFNETSRVSRDLNFQEDSPLKLGSPFKRSILYEHLLKDINSTTKNDHSFFNQSRLDMSINENDKDAVLKLQKSQYNWSVDNNVGACDNQTDAKIMNLSTKSTFSGDEDSAAPLNLCVKKSSTTLKPNSSIERNKCINVVNNLVEPNHQPTHTFSTNPQSSSPIVPQQKRRGRKPKALLNNVEQLANLSEISSFLSSNAASQQIHQIATNHDIKPRKRGRPPTLSPPHNSIAAHTSNLANSSSTLSSSYPFNLFNTPSDVLSSWPGLNALTAAAAAAAAAASGNPFGSQLAFNNIFNKLNSKDINNLNLLNTNLFGLKNNSQENDFIPKLPKNDKRIKEDNNFLSNFSSKNFDSSSVNKNSSAHKSHTNEKQLKIPLNHGWRRSTYITGFSKTGTIEGDVTYFGPCGKRIKSYPELMKYLSKNGITHLTKENFSFDQNVILGQYIENIQEFGSEVTLTENQVKVQLEEINKIRNFCIPSISVQQNNNVTPEKKKRVRDSGGTRNVYDQIKNFKSSTSGKSSESNHSKNELEPSITITVQNQSIGRGTKRKSSEPSKQELIRNEKIKKNEEKLREAREKREEEEERKAKEAKEKQLELQKQEEMKLLTEIENERANQHQMFINALNELKTFEERQQKKSELSHEKTALHERRLLKKALENELMKELKKPVEDMRLKDHKCLPTYNRIPGLKLTGKAFADSLMIYEFLYNFGDTIGFDIETLPNLNTLMMSLLNLDKEAEEELLSIVKHLLSCAIEDPGLPTNTLSMMGQKLKDAIISDQSLTEVLRLYFESYSSVVRLEDEYKRIECKIYDYLCTGTPFLSMNASYKLEILSFLCNELLSNQAIVKQIEDNIESFGTYKKDKWMIENDIRKLRLVKMKREKITELENAKQLVKESCENGDETVESDNDESSNTATASITTNINFEFEDDVSLTNEEIDKKIEKLNKQCNQINNKMHKSSNSYRVFPLGQDRYRRTYWVLPNCGGVFVEAMESGDPSELCNNVFTEEELKLLEFEENVEVNGDSLLNGSEMKDENSIKDEEEDIENQNELPKSAKVEQEEDNQQENNEIKSENHEENVNENQLNEDNLKENESNDDKEKVEVSTKEEPLPVNGDVDKQEIKSEPALESEKSEQKEESAVAKTESEEEKFEQIDDEDIDKIRWFDLDMDSECDIDEQANESKNNSDDESEKLDDADSKSESDDNIVDEMEKAIATFMDEDTLKCLFGNAHRNLDEAILKDRFIQILSSYSKSALITKFPNSEVNELEIIICPTLQKRVQICKVLQHEMTLKIPREYQLGWWRITDATQLRTLLDVLHLNALRERNLHKHLERHLNHAMLSCKNSTANFDVNDFDREASEMREFGAPTENKCKHKNCLPKRFCADVAFRVDLQVLELIESFEEKILSYNMQIRNWKPTNKITSADFKCKSSKNNYKDIQKKLSEINGDLEPIENETDFIEGLGKNNDQKVLNLVRVEKDRLLEIESVIERRFLKPPLGFKNNSAMQSTISTENANGEEMDFNEYATDDNCSAGLIRWRDAVRDSRCSSQVALCLNFLENGIAWEKSSVKPNVDKLCTICNKKGKLLSCDTCSKGYHASCIDSSTTKQSKGKFICHLCLKKNKRNSSSKSSKKSQNLEEKNGDSSSGSNLKENNKKISNGNSKEKPEKESKKERKSKKEDKAKKEDKTKKESTDNSQNNVDEMMSCRKLLTQMIKNENCWPFLEPVNTKQFPSYKKVIKKPMDFSTIQAKLISDEYKSKEEFAVDIRLIFDNCVTFNEDESPVGRAGHNLRAFFETNWQTLFGEAEQ